jgi:hypothetical protein
MSSRSKSSVLVQTTPYVAKVMELGAPLGAVRVLHSGAGIAGRTSTVDVPRWLVGMVALYMHRRSARLSLRPARMSDEEWRRRQLDRRELDIALDVLTRDLAARSDADTAELHGAVRSVAA